MKKTIRVFTGMFLLLLISISVHAGVIRLVSGEIDTSKQPQATVSSLKTIAGDNSEALTIVQFQGPIQTEWIDNLKQSGIKVHNYLPDYAYIVSFKPEKLNTIKSSKGVSWVGTLPTSYKINPRVAQIVQYSNEKEIKLTILSIDDTPLKKIREKNIKIKSNRMTQMGWYDIRLTTSPSMVEYISQIPSVFYIELQPEYELHGERAAQTAAGNYNPGDSTPTGPGYDQWLSDNGLTGGSGLIVQVQDDGLDQGIDTNAAGTAHPDILGRIAGIFNATSDALGDGQDGHGQINAGIIIGNATVGTMDTDAYLLGQGMAPQAQVYATKVFANGGTWDTGSYSLTDLAKDAQDAGARFSSNSWGAPIEGEYSADSAEFDSLVRDADPTETGNQSMVYFFSAGNDGPSESTLGAPASGKNVIAVGASENSDADGTDGCAVDPTGADNIYDLIDFSSRGPAEDNRLGVTVVAVGTHVQGPASTSPFYNGSGVCDMYWPDTQTDYARSSGTSHSCPIVCGAGMIVYDFFNTHNYTKYLSANPSPAMIKAVLVNTATDMYGGDNGSGGTLTHIPNSHQGWGNVNLGNLIDMKDSLYSFDQEHEFTQSGQYWEKKIISVDPSKPLKITLTWTDTPGTPSSNPAIINDLDLIVASEENTYLGNRFSNGFSSTGGTADRLNTLESVYIEHPSSVYTIRVNAYNIAGDAIPGNANPLDQDFALFASNAIDQTSKGVIFINKLKYNCSENVMITVSDLDLKGDGTVSVNISSTNTTDVESVVLNETETDSGIFEGDIALAVGSASSDDILQISDNDTITAVYNDADNGTGNPAVADITAQTDCTAPTLSDLLITDIDANSFEISFNTNEDAQANIYLGMECGSPLLTQSTSLRTTHSKIFSDLSECTPYCYWIELIDDVGNTSLYDNSGQCYWHITQTETDNIISTTDDFEPTANNGWTHQADQGNDNWHLDTSVYAHSPDNAYMYEPGTDYVSDARLITPEFQGGGEFSFWHTYNIENTYDGAVIEISTNGGNTWTDLETYITQGGYNNTVDTDYLNPIAGQNAWSGGTLAAMSEVKVDLSSFAGMTVQVAFRFASDYIESSEGWIIDDVKMDVYEVEPCVEDAGEINIYEEKYPCSSDVYLSVVDLNIGSDSLEVLITSDSGDSETVILNLVGVNTGYYEGYIQTNISAPQADGVLQVSDGDVITATYNDDDDGTGNPAVSTDTALIDCQPPVISNINATDISNDRFTISYNTNESAITTLYVAEECGGTPLYTLNTPLGTSHTLTIDGLSECSPYFYWIEAQDSVGNEVIDDNSGNCYFQITYINVGENIITDDFEPTPEPDWTHNADQGDDNWRHDTSSYAHSSSNVYIYEPGTDYISDARLITQVFSGGSEFSFWHTYNFEEEYDGGVIEISTDGGNTWTDLGPYITQGGYNNTIDTGYDSPIAGQEAWSGGTLNSMTEVKVDLSSFVGSVQVGFRFAADSGYESEAWVIDDVKMPHILTEPCIEEEGEVSINNDYYTCDENVEVEVRDVNIPSNSTNVIITTDGGDTETLELIDPSGVKIFAGSIQLGSAGAPIISEDGILQGDSVDIITASYHDLDNGLGADVVVTDTAILDCLDPIFAGIESAVKGDEEVQLSWQAAVDDNPITYNIYRSQDSQSQNFNTPYISTDNTSYTDTAVINGLAYWYVVRAEDIAGNEDNNSVELSARPIAQMDRLAFNTIGSPRNVNTPFDVQISAVDSDGNVIFDYNDTANLSGYIGYNTGDSPILISEIDPGNIDSVEFTNISASNVDISGWQITIYDYVSMPTPLITFTVPNSTTCSAGDYFQLLELNVSPGSYPLFYSGINFDWTQSSSLIAVLVQDDTGRIIDFATTGDSTSITSPIAIPSTQWAGDGIPLSGTTNNTYQREGDRDNNTNTDWSALPSTIAAINAVLTVPFTPAVSVNISPTSTTPFINGVWAGQITINDDAENIHLRAEDSLGWVGDSNEFNVVEPSDINNWQNY